MSTEKKPTDEQSRTGVPQKPIDADDNSLGRDSKEALLYRSDQTPTTPIRGVRVKD